MKKQNKIKKILLKIGVAIASLGALIGVLTIPSKAAENLPSSILEITNMEQVAYFYHTTNGEKYHFTFVKNGVFGYFDDYTWSTDNDQFYTSLQIQEEYKESIYTPYGLFYNTLYSSPISFTNNEVASHQVVSGYNSYLEYRFITPILLQNAVFLQENFDSIQFLDDSNNIIGYYVENDSITLNNVWKIRCILNDSTYRVPTYLINSILSTLQAQAYMEGYNSRNQEVDSLKNENITLQNVNQNLRNEVSTLQNQLQHVNGSWQSVFFSMVDIPFLTVSNVLNFDLFGLNLYRALIGMLTILAIFFLFRKLTGK